jgi:GMP synthase (glutamine-hydrolysing)
MENGNQDSMILIVQINNQKFHYFEFVKPIEDILKRESIKFKSVHYKKLYEKVILKAKKIIISGTSLKDNSFLDDITLFSWIKKLNKPILGICGGMHILGLLFNGELKKQQEIGLNDISFNKEFLGKYGTIQAYELHNYLVESDEFEIYSFSKNCRQTIKHKQKPLYGVLFHPEVRNKDIIINFAKL